MGTKQRMGTAARMPAGPVIMQKSNFGRTCGRRRTAGNTSPVLKPLKQARHLGLYESVLASHAEPITSSRVRPRPEEHGQVVPGTTSAARCLLRRLSERGRRRCADVGGIPAGRCWGGDSAGAFRMRGHRVAIEA